MAKLLTFDPLYLFIQNSDGEIVEFGIVETRVMKCILDHEDQVDASVIAQMMDRAQRYEHPTTGQNIRSTLCNMKKKLAPYNLTIKTKRKTIYLVEMDASTEGQNQSRLAKNK